ncbi:uncharacterized protein F5Z01DRAFT_667642 [Emericellopsis atlantica]|uniref:C2H2-type domain-containing protein n=1 Tax=Emericellopsis atlantica TaxID=2614577 RepID=A0A9P7ZDV0_9HYPO|nr:uncharacterized protein F5Z01DRAFT_667642 [Emericellopsis atlantica]KAG9249967.1 hypothetical protein F5Z01DRAFT_667642 [Emericellopsis atlantica]
MSNEQTMSSLSPLNQVDPSSADESPCSEGSMVEAFPYSSTIMSLHELDEILSTCWSDDNAIATDSDPGQHLQTEDTPALHEHVVEQKRRIQSPGRTTCNPSDDGRGISAQRRRPACEYPGCGKTYSRKEHLNRHIKNKHMQDHRKFICEFCGKAGFFNRADNLNAHRRLHTRPNTRKCRVTFDSEAQRIAPIRR